MKKVPVNSIDLIKELEKTYVDVLDTDANSVGTPEYWKKAGVVELVRMLKHKIEHIKDV